MASASSSFFGLGVIALILGPAAAFATSSCGDSHGTGSTFGGGGSNSSLHSSGPKGDGGSGGGSLTVGSSMMTSSGPGGDPKTCAQAAQGHTYIGCSFYPTVIANNVWSIFDFAVVVGNTGDTPANATVQRGGATVASATVMPNSVATLYLPWVADLKGPDTNSCGEATPLPGSVNSVGGAYHLTSDVPVTVYQFSALEYQGMGGPPGKNWAACPGNQICPSFGVAVGCFSFSNDASLLLPSTAMTPNYRLTGHEGWIFPAQGGNPAIPVLGPTFTVTGTENGTNVTVKLSAKGNVLAGGGIPATTGGGTVSFSLNEGDVVEIAGSPSSDFGGSLVQATKPVQVITGMPCLDVPAGAQACDHIEESVLPAETLGKHYLVSKVSGPNGNAVGQQVKLFGNVDGTTLTYPAGITPAGAPTTINAGQVVDLGIVTDDFEIKGDHEFAISTFTQGASIVDPGAMAPNQKGDPDQSQSIAVEQYRIKYAFLAPTDYAVNYVDIIAPTAAAVTIDGVPVPAPLFTPIGSSGFGVAHLNLVSGVGGAHLLESDKPAGIQVVGYGAYTSYMYPGGLNLGLIAPPPPK